MRTVSSVLAVAAVALAVALALALSSPAQAGPDPPLSYRAPDRCPAEEAFLVRLRSRLGPGQGAGSGRSLGVQITFANGRYVGLLSLVEAGRSTTKTLSDADCEELVNALSLVAALALETDDRGAGTGGAPAGASSSPAPLPASAPAAPGSVPASPTTTASSASPPVGLPGSAPASTKTSPTASPTAPSSPDVAARGAPEPSPAQEASEEASPTPSPRLGVGLSGLATTGPAPRPLFGGALAVSWMLSGTGAFRPVLEIGGAASFAPDASEAKGTASFTWLTAHAVAYLLQWPPGSGAVLRGGLAGDFGALLARGRDTTSPASSSRPWASLGAVVGVEVPVGSRFGVRVSAAVEAPLRRDRYAFGSTDFFEVPVVIATGALSIVAYAR